MSRWLVMATVAIVLVEWTCARITAQETNVVCKETSPSVFEFTVGSDVFTRLNTQGDNKPVLYPVYGPGQVPMTRAWPIDDRESLERDHPHHKSIWYGHGDVNGVDFWTEKGAIIVERASVDPERAAVTMHNVWRAGDQLVCREVTTVGCGASASARWIDFDIRLQAAFGPLRLGDTKEGFLAIRTHPHLRLTPDSNRGVPEVFGQAENSEGQRGKAIWGQRARWVFYSGPVEGHPVGVLILDHPGNVGHPTTWHARDYGLIAANPFGLHDFLGREPGAGEVRISADDELRLRYRFVFLRLDDNPIAIEDFYRAYVAEQ